MSASQQAFNLDAYLFFFCYRVVEFVDDDRLGYPPCLVLERGDQTLEQLMRTTSLDLFTRKSVLFQVMCSCSA